MWHYPEQQTAGMSRSSSLQTRETPARPILSALKSDRCEESAGSHTLYLFSLLLPLGNASSRMRIDEPFNAVDKMIARFPSKLIAAELEPHRVHSNPTLSGELGSNTPRKDKTLPGRFG